MKNTESRIQDRTTGTKYKEIIEILDTAQGGFGLNTKNKALTVEVLFKTIPQPGGGIITKFKPWGELRQNLSNENKLNCIVYCRMKQRYKHLIHVITERGYEIDAQLPSTLHWS